MKHLIFEATEFENCIQYEWNKFPLNLESCSLFFLLRIQTMSFHGTNSSDTDSFVGIALKRNERHRSFFCFKWAQSSNIHTTTFQRSHWAIFVVLIHEFTDKSIQFEIIFRLWLFVLFFLTQCRLLRAYERWNCSRIWINLVFANTHILFHVIYHSITWENPCQCKDKIDRKWNETRV